MSIAGRNLRNRLLDFRIIEMDVPSYYCVEVRPSTTLGEWAEDFRIALQQRLLLRVHSH
jgi:hypothetical protein